MVRLIATSAAICLIAGSSVAQSSTDKGPRGDTLNPEDCKVMAILGQDLLHWDKVKPDISTFSIFYRPQNGGYVEQCPWRELGIAPLPPGSPDMNNMRFFTTPRYGADGKSASVDFVTKLVAFGKDGKPMSPFIEVQTCFLTKSGSDWRLDSCHLSVVT
jgi:hypothetical protein